jgi:predicted nucleic acid-binding protein
VLLLDASVWVAATDKGDRYHASSRTITIAGDGVAVLDLTLYEVANAVTRRFKTVAPATAAAAVQAVLVASERVLRVDANAIADTVSIAAEHGLTAYDAAYVAAARHHDWTLVSTDIKDLVGRGLALAPDDPSIQRPQDG